MENLPEKSLSVDGLQSLWFIIMGRLYQETSHLIRVEANCFIPDMFIHVVEFLPHYGNLIFTLRIFNWLATPPWMSSESTESICTNMGTESPRGTLLTQHSSLIQTSLHL